MLALRNQAKFWLNGDEEFITSEDLKLINSFAFMFHEDYYKREKRENCKW